MGFRRGARSLFAGVGLTAILIPSAIWLLFAYYALTLWYSFGLKTRLLVDVFALAALYTISNFVRGAAYQVELSVWLLSFSDVYLSQPRVCQGRPSCLT